MSQTWIDRAEGVALLRRIAGGHEMPPAGEVWRLDGAAVGTDRRLMLALHGLADSEMPEMPEGVAGAASRMLAAEGKVPLGRCSLARLADWAGAYDPEALEDASHRPGLVAGAGGEVVVCRNRCALALAPMAAWHEELNRHHRAATGLSLRGLLVDLYCSPSCGLLAVGTGFRLVVQRLDLERALVREGHVLRVGFPPEGGG